MSECGAQVAGGVESGPDIHLTASFSFVHDLEHMAFMAEHLGETADAEYYGRMRTEMGQLWHDTWFNRTLGCYGCAHLLPSSSSSEDASLSDMPVLAAMVYGTFTCTQTSNAMGLILDAMNASERPRVVSWLAADVMKHSNHTTTGLLGWRQEVDALSKHGRDDLAWALMTQKTYPSLGVRAPSCAD